MKIHSLLLFLGLTSLTIMAKAPENYYSSLEGLNKADLKKAAKNVARHHTAVSYGDQTWNAFAQTDVRMVNGRAVWWDMYSPNEVAVESGHPGMNIEHSVANSWWGGTKNDAYKDLFHLNPSDADANNWKSNYPLGIVKTVQVTSKGVRYDNGVTKVGNPASGASGGAKYVYEPADCYKGDMARAFMYIFTIYDDIAWMSSSDDRNYMFDGSAYPSLRPWAVDLLLEWSRLDPVDTKETDRNEAIYKIQGNRNPFIDCPDLAEYIWGNKKDLGFVYDGSYEPGEPSVPGGKDPDDPATPDDPQPPTVAPEGTWVIVQPGDDISADVRYALVSCKTNAVMSSTLNGAYFNPTASVATVTDGVISELPVGAAILTISPAESGYSILVSDASGEKLGYMASATAKKMSLTETPTDNSANASIEITADGADISFGAAGNIFYNPNKGAERFTTYTSTTMEHVQLFRRIETPVVPVVPLQPVIYALDQDGDFCEGVFKTYALVEITYPGEESNVRLYYTLDGTDPEVDLKTMEPATPSTIEYKDVFEVNSDSEIRAIAASEDATSDIAYLKLIRDNSEQITAIGIEEAPVRYFDLTGREMTGSPLPSGLYIRVKGLKADKVIIR